MVSDYMYVPAQNRLALALAAMPDKAGMADGRIGQRAYRYVPIQEVLRLVKPELAKYGLSVTQEAEVHYEAGSPGRVTVTTVILDQVTGEEVTRGEIDMPVDTRTGGSLPQCVGASITYARRYGLMTLLSLAFDEDTDAQIDERVVEEQKIRERGRALIEAMLGDAIITAEQARIALEALEAKSGPQLERYIEKLEGRREKLLEKESNEHEHEQDS